VADFHHPNEAAQSALINLVLAQEFRVVEKIPQEPTQLPHRLRSAVQPADDRTSGEWLGFENGEPEQVEAFLIFPAVLRSLEPDQEYAVGNLASRTIIGVSEPGNVTFHATTS